MRSDVPAPTLLNETPITTLGLLALLGLSPFLPDAVLVDPGPHNAQRILESFFLSILPVCVLVLAATSAFGPIAINRSIAVALGGFFLAGFLSSVISFSPRLALLEWSIFLLLVSLAFVVACDISRTGAAGLRYILTACGIGCLAYELNVLLIYIAALSNETVLTGPGFVFGFENYRFFNHTQTVSLPLIILLSSLQPRFSRQHLLWFIVAASWWMLLLVSGGRGTALGLIVGVVTVLVQRRRLAWQWTAEWLATAVAGTTGYFLVFYVVPMVFELGHWGAMSDVLERSVADPTSGRIALWNLALEMIRTEPLLGFGPVHFAHLSSSLDAGAHPHNWFLQIGAEWGVPALLMLCTGVVLAANVLLHRASSVDPDDSESQLFICAWITGGAAILVDGLVSGLIVMPLSQLWLALYAGLVWGWCISTSKPHMFGMVRRPRIAVAVSFGVAVLVAVMWRGLLPEALAPALQDKPMRALDPDGLLRPRIWTAGYF